MLIRKYIFFAITALFTALGSITAIKSLDIKPNLLNAYATVAGFNVELTGNEEVPPVQTDATGSAEFTAPHFDNIGYSVTVSNMDKVTAAHIHSGKQGENGPIVVTLFKADTPSSEPINGNLASGNITNANPEDPMAGKIFDSGLIQPKEFIEYVAANLSPGNYTFYTTTDPTITAQLSILQK